MFRKMHGQICQNRIAIDDVQYLSTLKSVIPNETWEPCRLDRSQECNLLLQTAQGGGWYVGIAILLTSCCG